MAAGLMLAVPAGVRSGWASPARSLAEVAAAVRTLGTCAYERFCLLIVSHVDLWTYAAPEKEKKGIIGNLFQASIQTNHE
jgi:hypothetical protein